jgi:hypothetical protein
VRKLISMVAMLAAIGVAMAGSAQASIYHGNDSISCQHHKSGQPCR